MNTKYKVVVDENQPLIVLIGEHSKLSLAIQNSLEKKSVQVALVTVDSGVDFLENLQRNPYKVIVVQSVQSSFNPTVERLLNYLSNQDYSITCIVPVITAVQESNTVFSRWYSISIKQKKSIEYLNSLFPNANFLFLMDVIDIDGDVSPLDFMLMHVSQLVIYDPKLTFYFQTVMSVLSEIIRVILQPHRSKSYLIQGDIIESRSVIVQIKRELQSYYQKNCLVEKKQLQLGTTLPFSVTNRVLTGDHASAITEFSRSISFITDSKIEETYKKEVEKKQLLSESENTENELYEEDFTIQENSTPLHIPPQEETIDVNKELQRIFDIKRTTAKLGRVKQISKNTQKIASKSKNRKILFVGGLSSAFLSVCLIFLTLIFISSQKRLANTLIKATETPVHSAALSQKTITELQKKTTFLTKQKNTYSSIFDETMFSDAEVLVSLSHDVQNIGETKDQYKRNTADWISSFRGENISETTISTIISSAELYFQHLQSVYDGIKFFNETHQPYQPTSILDGYEQELESIKNSILSLTQLESHLLDILGGTQKKTYAVLLQNNQELRPTGGFIQAVALVSFDKGSLASVDVYSSYEIDQQLAGVVEAPEAIEKYLGEERWFLRDSNWNPHFPESAASIRWFLEKSISRQVDGVVALDLNAFASFLEVIGPVELSSFNEVITHKNIFERMEFHSEVVLVKTAHTKDYSSELFLQFFNKLREIPAQTFADFASVLKQNLDEHTVYISLFDEKNSPLFSQLGWDGSIINPPCPTELATLPCVVESVAQYEANVGVNKANYYINSSIDHTIKIEPKMVHHTRRMTYKNRAESNSWPKGAYKSYIRLYIPKNAVVSSVLVNTRQLDASQVTEEFFLDKKVIGFLFDVPIQSTTSIEVSFDTPQSDEAPYSYAFFNQKQLGVIDTPVAVNIIPHPELHPTLIAPQAKLVADSILFDQSFSNHSLFAVRFE